MPGAGCGEETGRGADAVARRWAESVRAEVERQAVRILRRLDELMWAAQKLDVAEFAEYFRHPRRVLLVSFATGVARGIGIAVGFTLLGAVALWFLERLLLAHLPGLGHFVAELVRLVNRDLTLGP